MVFAHLRPISQQKNYFHVETLDENQRVGPTNPKSSIVLVFKLMVFDTKIPINTLSPGTGPTVGPYSFYFHCDRTGVGQGERDARYTQTAVPGAKTAPVLLAIQRQLDAPSSCNIHRQNPQAARTGGKESRCRWHNQKAAPKVAQILADKAEQRAWCDDAREEDVFGSLLPCTVSYAKCSSFRISLLRAHLWFNAPGIRK